MYGFTKTQQYIRNNTFTRYGFIRILFLYVFDNCMDKEVLLGHFNQFFDDFITDGEASAFIDILDAFDHIDKNHVKVYQEM